MTSAAALLGVRKGVAVKAAEGGITYQRNDMT